MPPRIVHGAPSSNLGETGLAYRPTPSPVFPSPVLANEVHQRLVAESIYHARRLGKLVPQGATALFAPVNGVFSLAQWQSPFKRQNDRGTCWAFAGAAALEAAYRRKFNIAIDVSEEYVFHMGKSFALNRDQNGNVATPVENNSSLYGFQGSGDIVKKLSENAVAPEWAAPYLENQSDLVAILPMFDLPSLLAVDTQEEYDAVEFCEQHIPLLARVNARYRATGWKSLGGNPSVEALENTLLAEHEVVCDVQTPLGGHVLLLIGFDRNRKVFFAKNSWAENRFIEIQYANDPNWTILSGWYIEDVVDPTFVQNEACWLGNWWVTQGSHTFRVLLRRSEDFVAPGTATKLGTAYLGDGAHDVNGFFLNNGSHLRFFIAPTTLPETPGALEGTQFDVHLNFQDIYNASGAGGGQRVTMSRFATRFAAIFEEDDGTPWQARHGIDAHTYQATFDSLVQEGYRLTSLCGYSEGTGARFNAIWHRRGGPAWQARHGLNAADYQATFDSLGQEGYRLTCVSGYAENGEARYAGNLGAARWPGLAGAPWPQPRAVPAGVRRDGRQGLCAHPGLRLPRECRGAVRRDLGKAGRRRVAGAARPHRQRLPADLRPAGRGRHAARVRRAATATPASRAMRRSGSVGRPASGRRGTASMPPAISTCSTSCAGMACGRSWCRATATVSIQRNVSVVVGEGPGGGGESRPAGRRIP